MRIPLLDEIRHLLRMGESSWIKRTGSLVIDKVGDALVTYVLAGGGLVTAIGVAIYAWWWQLFDFLKTAVFWPSVWVITALVVGFILVILVSYAYR